MKSQKNLIVNMLTALSKKEISRFFKLYKATEIIKDIKMYKDQKVRLILKKLFKHALNIKRNLWLGIILRFVFYNTQ